MSEQDHLLKTLDLALTPSEAGAVNFTHLRALLLGLINSKPHGVSSTEEYGVGKDASTTEKVCVLYEYHKSYILFVPL